MECNIAIPVLEYGVYLSIVEQSRAGQISLLANGATVMMSATALTAVPVFVWTSTSVGMRVLSLS